MLMRPWVAVRNGWNRFEQLPETAAYRPALAATYPPVNVWENDENVYVEAELPGVPKDRLELIVRDGNQFALQGERPAPEAGKGVWHRQERGLGRFGRTFLLPASVDADRGEARFDQGVLTVTLPKAEEAKPRRIPVQAG